MEKSETTDLSYKWAKMIARCVACHEKKLSKTRFHYVKKKQGADMTDRYDFCFPRPQKKTHQQKM